MSAIVLPKYDTKENATGHQPHTETDSVNYASQLRATSHQPLKQAARGPRVLFRVPPPEDKDHPHVFKEKSIMP